MSQPLFQELEACAESTGTQQERQPGPPLLQFCCCCPLTPAWDQGVPLEWATLRVSYCLAKPASPQNSWLFLSGTGEEHTGAPGDQACRVWKVSLWGTQRGAQGKATGWVGFTTTWGTCEAWLLQV